MRVFRICREPHRALDGEGARLYSGRWTSAGHPVVYTSDSLALAALEYLVHLNVDDVPADLVALTIEIPDDLPGASVKLATLPRNWAEMFDPPACKAAGDAWTAAGATSWLRVPAAPIPEASNILLNARHPGAKRIVAASTRPFHYDPRLLA